MKKNLLLLEKIKECKNNYIYSILNLIIITILTLSMVSYFQGVYENNYSILRIFIIVLIFVFDLLLVKLDKKIILDITGVIKKNKIILLLCLVMLLSNFLVFLFNFKLISSFINVGVIVFTLINVVLVIPYYLKKHNLIDKLFIKYIAGSSFILALIAIYIYHIGPLFEFELIHSRASSLMFDPNFFGTFIAIGVIFMLKQKKVIFSIPMIYAVYLSGSRGALVSLLIGMIYYVVTKILQKKDPKLTAASIAILLITTTMVVFYLYKSDFLRIYNGSNGRIEMILNIVEMNFKQPFIGYGYGTIGEHLIYNDVAMGSTHNSIIDFWYNYGTITLIILLTVYVKAFLSSLNSKKLYISTLIVILLTNMNTVLFSLGGVGICSILFSIIIGISLLEKKGK